MSAIAARINASERFGEGKGLGVVAWILIVIGLWMAAMPYVGSIIGLPFDGREVWEINANRVFLHILPGLIGAGMGAAMLVAHRRKENEGIEYPRWLGPLALAAVGVATWNAVGPWLMEALLPATVQESALMFSSIPGYENFTALHQFTLQFVCHGMPGMITLAGAYAAFRISQSLPMFGLGGRTAV